MNWYEYNFDGLIGPTHNYSGLSLGNVASMTNKKQVANPQQACLQGLKKMKDLHDLGFKQGLLAPHCRPHLGLLKQLGFSGSNYAERIRKAYEYSPGLLASLSSASAMWTANAATISPSPDTRDGKIHITPANLVNKFHRFIEPEVTSRILKKTFKDDQYFTHHSPLPSHENFGDEGAANHTRFCNQYGEAGVEFFVYGRFAEIENSPAPKKFPARQTKEASEAVARLHQLYPEKTIYAQQNPAVIDQGVFHNDVIAVGNRNCLFYHEQAFLNSELTCESIAQLFNEFHFIKVSTSAVSVSDAVTSYLFNSQLLSLPNGKMALVVPEESRQNQAVWSYLSQLTQDHSQPISEVLVKDVKQSMKNGGGPACLRLRVVLNESEARGVNPKTILTDSLYTSLVSWAKKHYREELSEQELADPLLYQECETALDELTQILDLGSIYDFQL